MLIGILVEGKYDEQPFEIVTRRVSELLLRKKEKEEIVKCFTKRANGDVRGLLNKKLCLYFKTLGVDVIIIVSDFGYSEDRGKQLRRSIREKTKRVLNSYGFEKIVFAFPQPEFEQWFIDEEDTLKLTFSLGAENSVPNEEMEAKERVERFIAEQRDISKTKLDYYSDFAEAINLDRLMGRSNSFKRFVRELEGVL